jgi:ligand-binding sensor domain-containing protein/signal transduction histidine kinase
MRKKIAFVCRAAVARCYCGGWLLLALAGVKCEAAEEYMLNQDPDHVIVNWEVQDGLPSARINDVIQMRDGYMWLATLNGLARFDGIHFERFYQAETPGLATTMVSCLLEDSQARLWYGTQSGELGWKDSGGFHLINFPSENLLDRVNRIVETQDGTIWAASRQRLLSIKNGQPQTLIVRPERHDIWDICAAEGGGLWVLVDGGNLYLLDTKTQKMSLVIPGQPGQWRNIISAHAGGLWVREGQCIRRWQGDGWVEDRGVLDLQITENACLWETQSGNLIVGTYGQGLWIVDASGRQRKLDRNIGLSHDQVLSLCEDQEGNLWAGTVHGLNRITRRVVKLVVPPDNWQNRATTTITPSATGELWVGTEGAGLYKISLDGQVKFHQSDDLWRQDYIRCVLEDSKRQVWSGLFYFGLWLRDKAHSRGQELPESRAGSVNALFEDSQDNVWVGTTKGVAQYAGQLQPAQLLLTNKDVRCFAEGKDGSIWMGLQSGELFSYQSGVVKAYSAGKKFLSSAIHALAFDVRGTLWIATWRNGLVFFKDGDWGVLRKEQGLPDNFISNIQLDEAGNLWVGSSSGIFRIGNEQLNLFTTGKIKTVNCLQLGSGDGLGTWEISGGSQPTACRTTDGRLWYVTSVGLVAFDPKAIRPNHLPPPMAIESILADGRQLRPADTDSAVPLDRWLLRCPAGTRQVEIHFTALSLSSPQQVRFRYRLDGLDNRWIETSSPRAANFFHLPPGRYTFEVTACNNQGVWNEAGCRLSFEVMPLFWQTIWFKLLVTLAVVVVIAAVYRARAVRLRALERLRQQIARDLHDEVGANLGSISLLTEVMERKPHPNDLAQIRSTADQTVETLRDLVWIINPSHERLADLVARLRQIANLMLADVTFRFHVQEPLADARTSLELRRNVPPLFKEILHNILKHSGARFVDISIACPEDRFVLEVSDDGVGFNVAATRGGGNGLKNFQNRAAEMGGEVKVQSQPGGGTTIRITAPITKPRDWRFFLR